MDASNRWLCTKIAHLLLLGTIAILGFDPFAVSKSQNKNELTPEYQTLAEFIDYRDAKSSIPVVDSIIYIITAEYGTSINGPRFSSCDLSIVRGELSGALEKITVSIKSTLTDHAPTFGAELQYESTNKDPIQGLRNICYVSVANKQPLPFINSLEDVLSKYTQASLKFIDEQREGKKSAYEAELAKEKEKKKEIAAKAAATELLERQERQKRIDIERARIEEEERSALDSPK